jgi:hypothetical protein
MKRSIVTLALLAMAFAVAAPAIAGGESYIRTHNETGKYVWITVYSKPMGLYSKQEGAWCVKPHSFDDHGLRVVIHKVRAELSDVGCQHEPRYLDTTLTVEPREIGRYNDITFAGYVQLRDGKLMFTH